MSCPTDLKTSRARTQTNACPVTCGAPDPIARPVHAVDAARKRTLIEVRGNEQVVLGAGVVTLSPETREEPRVGVRVGWRST